MSAPIGSPPNPQPQSRPPSQPPANQNAPPAAVFPSPCSESSSSRRLHPPLLLTAPSPPQSPPPSQPPPPPPAGALLPRQQPKLLLQQYQQPTAAPGPRFAHCRRGADPALSSEGGGGARQPISHTPTPSSGSIPVVRSQTVHAAVPTNHTAHHGPGPQRKQGKPIIEWFKGKLGARRPSDADQHRRDDAPGGGGKHIVSGKAQPPPPVVVQSLGYRQPSPANTQAAQTRQTGQIGQTSFGPVMLSPVRSNTSADSSVLRKAESMSVRSFSMSYSPGLSTERRRELNNPYPSLPIPIVRQSYPASTITAESRPASDSVLSRSLTSSLVSLSSFAANRRPHISIPDNESVRESMHYAGGGLSADDDASVRPIPPSPSHSMSIISKFGSEAPMCTDSIPRRAPDSRPVSSSQAAHEQRDTYSPLGGGTSITSDDIGRSRENSLASTKPTTIMSFDSMGPPVAHIAVAPTTSLSSSSPPVGETPSISSPPLRPSSASQSMSSPVSTTFLPPSATAPDDVRVPRHTRYHPRNNPHPSAAPAPDASIVTLASSTFALGGGSERPPRPTSTRSPSAAVHGSSSGMYAVNPTSPTVAFADAPGSMYDGLSSHALSFNARSRGYGRCDDDASMRAIRRRGSWESAESRWSWRPGTETGGMFAALGARGSQSHADAATEDAVGVVVGAGTNRSSTYTRESYRTAYSTWAQPPEPESGDLSTLASEPSLVSHRPVSVKV